MTTYMVFLSVFLLSLNTCGQKNKEIPKQESQQEIIAQQEPKHTTMSTNTQNATANPESVIKSLMAAMATNDAEKIRSLFAENASQAYGDGAAKSGKAFFSWLQSDIIERKGHVENAQYEVNGHEVVVTGQYSSKGYTNKANFLFKVEEGKIISWQMRY